MIPENHPNPVNRIIWIAVIPRLNAAFQPLFTSFTKSHCIFGLSLATRFLSSPFKHWVSSGANFLEQFLRGSSGCQKTHGRTWTNRGHCLLFCLWGRIAVDPRARRTTHLQIQSLNSSERSETFLRDAVDLLDGKRDYDFGHGGEFFWYTWTSALYPYTGCTLKKSRLYSESRRRLENTGEARDLTKTPAHKGFLAFLRPYEEHWRSVEKMIDGARSGTRMPLVLQGE